MHRSEKLRDTQSLTRFESLNNLFSHLLPSDRMATLRHSSSSLSSHHRSKGSTGLSAVLNCQLSLFPASSFLSPSLHFNFSTHLDSISPQMSTSSSTACPSASGECVVCGKESSTRCSSCAKGGVDWMFFCSIDHQKLVRTVLPSSDDIRANDVDSVFSLPSLPRVSSPFRSGMPTSESVVDASRGPR